MKNVQVIDGADNCTYSIYRFTDEEFDLVFPGDGQDIEFVEDLMDRLGDRAGPLLKPVWERMVSKETVSGIHGTLFFELTYKKRYYPTKKDKDMKTGFEKK